MKEKISKVRRETPPAGPPFELVLDGTGLSVAVLHRFLEASEVRVTVAPEVEARVRAASDQLSLGVGQGGHAHLRRNARARTAQRPGANGI